MSSCLIFFLFGNLYATTNHCSQVKSLLNKQKGIIADVADVIYDHNYFYFAISLRMKYSIPDRCTIKRFHAFLITSKNGKNYEPDILKTFIDSKLMHQRYVKHIHLKISNYYTKNIV